MNKEQAKQIVSKNFDLSEEVNANFNKVDAILTFSEHVFGEANDIMKRSVDYLNSPADDGGKNAPLAEWKGPNPVIPEAHKAFNRLQELMKNSLELISEMAILKKKFNEFKIRYSAYLNQQNEDFVKMKLDTTPFEKIDFIQLEKTLHDIPGLSKEINSLNSIAGNHEVELKKIKNQLMILKGVN